MLGQIDSGLYASTDWSKWTSLALEEAQRSSMTLQLHTLTEEMEGRIRGRMSPDKDVFVVLKEYYSKASLPSGIQPFLLPVGGAGGVTTTVVVQLRFGKRFEMVAKYMSSETAYNIACKYPQTRGTADARDVDKRRWALLTGGKQPLLEGQNPSKVQLDTRLQPLLGTVHVWQGAGHDFDIDRAYVSEELHRIMGRNRSERPTQADRDSADREAVILEELIVFVPCTLLRGINLVDAPGTMLEVMLSTHPLVGTNDSDEIRDNILEREVRLADNLILFMNGRHLGANSSIKNLLQPLGEEGELRSSTSASCSDWIRDKLLKNPHRHSLLVFHFMVCP